MTDTTHGTRAIASTVSALPGSARERFGDALAARYKSGDEWREITYGEVGEAIDEIALGLVALGIERGDRVCVLADTRLEWTLASYGISAAGGVVVPVYPTNSPKECAWVAGNSEARAVVVENETQAAKIEEIRSELPHLETVIGMEAGVGEISLDQVRERGRGGDHGELEDRQSQVTSDDPYTIVYTSGTTGPPKGVVLSHRNAMTVCDVVEKLQFVQPGEITYLYLPLAHVFALLAQLASYDQGTAIVYLGGDTRQILAEIIETKPTYLPSVPRIFEKIYAAAMKLQEQASDEDRERFRQGGQTRRRGAAAARARRAGPARARGAIRARRPGAVPARARPVRRPRPPGGDRRRADRGRDPGVLLRRRRARARGLGHDRDDRCRHRRAA